MPRPQFPQTHPTGQYDERNEREFRRLVELHWPADPSVSDTDKDGGFAGSVEDDDYDGGTA